MKRRSVAFVLVAAVLLAGCRGGEPDGATRSPAPSGGSSSAAGEPSESSSSSAEASVPPAEGGLIRAPSLSIRVPKGYRVDRTYSISITASAPSGPGLIVVGLLDGMPRRSRAELVRTSRKVGLWLNEPRRLPNVTIDGVRMYHLRGRSDAVRVTDEYGVWRDGTIVTLRFRLEEPLGGTRERIIESTLASLRWR